MSKYKDANLCILTRDEFGRQRNLATGLLGDLAYENNAGLVP